MSPRLLLAAVLGAPIERSAEDVEDREDEEPAAVLGKTRRRRKRNGI